MRGRDRLGAAVDPELHEDVLDVRGDGLRADDEPLGDLPLIHAVREESEHLALSRRQEYDARRCLGCAGLRGQMPADPGDELVGIQRLDHVVVRSDEQAGRTVERLGPHGRD
jgi:hypothetical protein